MAEQSRGLLFRKRNILGAALVAGIGMGVYLGKLGLPGFGGGTWFGIGRGDGQAHVSGDGQTHVSTEPGSVQQPQPEKAEPRWTGEVPDVVRVLIDDHQFLLRSKSGDTPVELPDLIQLIRKAPGDRDGCQVRIYESLNARAKSEEDLKQALHEAKIPDNAILWLPPSMK